MADAAVERHTSWARPEVCVGSGLISATKAPTCRATIGRLGGRMHQARGAHDEDEVGLTLDRRRRALESPQWQRLTEPDHARPHHTARALAAPRRRDPQGGPAARRRSRRHDQPESYGAPHSEHRNAMMLPCRWTTSALPARSCRSSTFCVTTRTGALRAHCARATWPAFGCAARTSPTRQRYQPQTRLGVGRPARRAGQRHRVSAPTSPDRVPRKVGMPDSADIPAPVSTTTRRAARAASTRSGGVSRTRVRPGSQALVEKVEDTPDPGLLTVLRQHRMPPPRELHGDEPHAELAPGVEPVPDRQVAGEPQPHDRAARRDPLLDHGQVGRGEVDVGLPRRPEGKGTDGCESTGASTDGSTIAASANPPVKHIPTTPTPRPGAGPVEIAGQRPQPPGDRRTHRRRER